MAGRDLSNELFGSSQAPGGRDLSGDLFGAPAVKPLSRTERVLKGIRDPIDAGAQLLTNMLPEGIVDAGNRLNNYIAEKTGLVAPIKTEVTQADLITGDTSRGIDRMIKQAEREYQARRAAGGESGIDAYRLAGNVISPANLAIASRLPQAATLAGRVGVGALGGAASGGLTPVSDGDFTSEKLKQIAVGGVVGSALPVLTGGIARVVSPNASRNANLQLLRSEGVQPTVGQALGPTASRVEERLQSLPLMGDMIGKARQRANQTFEQATINRALRPIGQSLPEGVSGRDAIIYTETALKDQYDNVLNNIGAIVPDQQFNKNVANLQNIVNRLVMPKAEKAKFTAALSDVQQSIDNNGVITSDAYKLLESSLGSDARKLAGSQNVYEGKIANSVKQLREELQSMLQRQAGQEAQNLKAVNEGWANFKRVQRAASALGAEEGNFTPAQFQNAVRALDKSKDKGAFARGSALGQDIGDAGRVVLGNRVPNSGTPERMLLNLGALGSGAISPAIPIGLAGGAGLYLSPVQRALVNSIASRPQSAQATAQAFRNATPLLGGGAGQFGLGLLNAE